MGGFRHAGAGAQARLVAAITDFVAEYTSQHAAAMIRQGIIPR